MEKLIVKNFGAIRNIEIDLKDLTIFIGKTGTGKSTLAKLVSIFRSADFWEDTDFSKSLKYYQIDNLLESSTFMEYQSKIGAFVYNHGKIEREFSEDILRSLAKLAEITTSENTNTTFIQRGQKREFSSLLIKGLFNSTCNEVIYIPAERGVVSFLSQKYAAMDRKEFTHLFPETLLDFTAAFNLASSAVGKLPIDLFDVTYQKENGKDYIVLPNGKQFLLSEAASGQQTAIPAIVIFEYVSQDEKKKSYTLDEEPKKKSYTLEEPELNLFPIAQKSLVELLAEKVLSNGHKVVITTHSPYILTAFNTLVQAGNVCKNNPHQKDTVSKIVPEKNWLNFDEVSVFYLDDSKVQDVMNLEYQTIDANAIDDVSDMIATEYDQLLELKYEQEE